jgi:P-type Cu+ transporter
MTSKVSSVVDPVCGMAVTPESAAGMSRVGDEAFYFCSAGCNAKFDASPERYAGQRSQGGAADCCSTANGRSSCH